ncbi:MAG TPA: RDD family protein, partial [Ilumatobacter sp.]|nr:RDD family protein [Ilumatobacter sp.]
VEGKAGPDTGTPGAVELPEGATVVVAGDVASRISAFVLDALIVAFGTLVLLTVLGFVHGPVLDIRSSGELADRVEIDPVRFGIDTAASTALAALYFAGSWTRRRATFGQRAIGLEVLPAGDVTAGLTVFQGIVRFLAMGAPLWVIAGFASGNVRLLFWCLGLGWYGVLAITVVGGSSATGIHDRIARTVVVRHVRLLELGAGPDRAVAS